MKKTETPSQEESMKRQRLKAKNKGNINLHLERMKIEKPQSLKKETHQKRID